jgi:hypothetical protein
MIISNDILEKTCKDMIETILFCLPDATKGTIYRVGPMPRLQVTRITSGVRKGGLDDDIQWGLAEISGYNEHGRDWEQYKDRDYSILEAMAWCVEKQKSWTADDPCNDLRSVRRQLSGEIEDFHHMEPVLVKKTYLYNDRNPILNYPLDQYGKPIWRDAEYVVAAIIKIHFKPYTIRRGDRSTKIIKKLSQRLGTELLSLHIRETMAEAQKELTRQRLQSCNVLAHELRNTLIKLGFIFSAINAEISFIREQWEIQIDRAVPEFESKKQVLGHLESYVLDRLQALNGTGDLPQVCRQLLLEQQELAASPMMPHLGERWLNSRILPKWNRLLMESKAWEEDKVQIGELLKRLQTVIWQGLDEQVIGRVPQLPVDLKDMWSRIAYTDFTADKVLVLEDIKRFLEHPALDIPHKTQTRKIITSLKALVEMIPEVEERANRIIYSLKNGCPVEGAEA